MCTHTHICTSTHISTHTYTNMHTNTHTKEKIHIITLKYHIFKVFFPLPLGCVYVYGSVHVSTDTNGGQKRLSELKREATVSLCVGPRNWTHVVWKSNKHSSMLNHLSNSSFKMCPFLFALHALFQEFTRSKSVLVSQSHHVYAFKRKQKV